MLHQHNPNPNPNQQNIHFASKESALHPPGTTTPYPNMTSYSSPQPQHPHSFPGFQLNPNAPHNSWLLVHQTQPVTHQTPVQGPNEHPVVYSSSSHPVQGPNEHPLVYASSSHPVQGLSEHPVVYASPGHVYNHNWANQPMVNQSTNVKLEQHKPVQPVRCELCNIECNSRDVLDKHTYGKKHMKNLQARAGLSAALPHLSSTVGHLISSGQMGTMGGQLVHGASSIGAGAELHTETTNVLNGGGTAVSDQVGLGSLHGVGSLIEAMRSNINNTLSKPSNKPKIIGSVSCEVCKINCNSEEIYANHLAGKKHQKNLGKVRDSTENNAKKPVAQSVWCAICKINCNSEEIYANHLAGKKHQKNLGKLGDSTENNVKNLVAQTVCCEVCDINCSQEDYIKHLTGKKHQKNLGKVRTLLQNKANVSELIGPSSASTSIIGPMENPKAEKGEGTKLQESQKRPAQHLSLPEDLETKRRKVLEGGAEAGAVRTCTICNVVCNSETVYSFHLAGQKHAAMLKRQAATKVATTVA